MSPREIPVACVQARAHDRDDFDRAWPRIARLADDAAREAALVVLPEGTVPAYVLGTRPVDAAQLERAHGDLAAIARARRATIVYGAARVVEGRTYNAAIAIGPDGDELGLAAKQFLWHFDRRWFAAGETLAPVDSPAGRLGLLVCADGRIPTIAATLAERGAELLVMPTAWVTSGRDPAALENIQADLFAPVRARENALPFVICNKAGVERESVAYCGKSLVIDAAGTVLARGPERDEAIVRATVRTGDRALPPQPPPLDAGAAPADGVGRARVAFTLASEPRDVVRLAALAADAGAACLLAFADAPDTAVPVLPLAARGAHAVAGLRLLAADDATLHAPRGLVAARLAGIDLVAWLATGDPAWTLAVARTRAAELRAYVVVFDRGAGRAYAVDPDGAVVAGTFDGLRAAAFAYDRARAEATLVAPATDVLEGLRAAERIRAGASSGALAP